jgi:hypothetical protein
MNRIKWQRHSACIEDNIQTYTILNGKMMERDHLENPDR